MTVSQHVAELIGALRDVTRLCGEITRDIETKREHPKFAELLRDASEERRRLVSMAADAVECLRLGGEVDAAGRLGAMLTTAQHALARVESVAGGAPRGK